MFESYLLQYSLIWNEPAPHLITAIMHGNFLRTFSCFPDVSQLFPIPCSDVFKGLLLHTISTAMDCITVCLPSNNKVIKIKSRQ